MVKRLAALCLMLLCLPVLQAQPINSFMIDSFNPPTGTVPDPILDGNGVWAGFNAGSSVLGGHRVVGNYLTEVIVGMPPGPYNNSTQITSNVFSVSNPFDTRSAGQVIWQGDDVTPGTDSIIAHPASFNLGNVNFNTLLSSPNFNFQWSVINADGRNWTYTVRAYTDNASNYFEGAVVSSDSGVVLSILKSDFSTVGTPDWANIDAVSFSTSYEGGALGGDLAIDCVQLAVPEPSAYLMIGLTAAVVGCYYIMKRRADNRRRVLA